MKAVFLLTENRKCDFLTLAASIYKNISLYQTGYLQYDKNQLSNDKYHGESLNNRFSAIGFIGSIGTHPEV